MKDAVRRLTAAEVVTLPLEKYQSIAWVRRDRGWSGPWLIDRTPEAALPPQTADFKLLRQRLDSVEEG